MRLAGTPRRRLKSHGDFAESARISQGIKALLRSGRRWARMSAAKREAAEMEAFKLARIVSGDPDHRDHWRDVSGYGHLGERDCKARRRQR